jgi:hypothetical protein
MTFLLPALAILGAQAKAAVPPVDRSGEPAMRELFAKLATFKKFHAIVRRTTRNRSDEYPEGDIEIWRDGEKFRVEYFDMWGDSLLLISDGKVLLEDSGYDPVLIRKSPKTWIAAYSGFEPRGGVSSPLHGWLDGPAVLEKTDKDKPMKLDAATGEIKWATSSFGDLSVSKPLESGTSYRFTIGFNNLPYQTEMHLLAPEWYDSPSSDVWWIHRVEFDLKPSFRKDFFSPKPSPGRAVNDMTKVPDRDPG